MRKLNERWEKTFIEKYGINSVLDEIEECTTKNKYLDQVDLYKLLPYLGMLYIPVNRHFKRLLPDDAAFIVNGLCPVKVVSVDEKEAVIYEFDDHEKWWNVKTFRHKNYLIKGNELILAPHYEALLYLIK